MSGKGQKMSSARRGFSLRRFIACAAVCVVALCAVLTGVGYGLGWFAGGEDASRDVTTESANSDEQNAGKNEVADDASVQDADISAVTEEVETDLDDQGDQVDEVAAESDSDVVIAQEETPENTDAGIAFDTYSGEESPSVEDQSSDQSTPSDSNASTSQNLSDTSGQSTNNSSSSNTGNERTSDRADSAQKSDAAAAPTVTVSVYIDSSRAAPYGYPSCLGDMTVSVEQGSSVLDALKATGLSINATSSGYVSSIAGLAERACGSGSGWLYFVNGVSPSSSCAKYILNGGEKIEWIYTCNMGNDV